MSFRLLFRLLVLVTCSCYSIYYAPLDRWAIYWGEAITTTIWGSPLESFSTVSIHIIDLICVVLAFTVMPRYRWGTRLLALALLLLGLLLLHPLEEVIFTFRHDQVYFAINGTISAITRALPAFILSTILWQPVIIAGLQGAPNQALQPTALPRH